jgi:hypothetical protein
MNCIHRKEALYGYGTPTQQQRLKEVRVVAALTYTPARLYLKRAGFVSPVAKIRRCREERATTPLFHIITR